VEAVDHSAATIYGFKHFPGKYDRAVDMKVDEGVRKKLAGVVEHLFLQEGKTPEEAKRAAEIFIQGRYGPPYTRPVDLAAEEAETDAAGLVELRESFKAKYLREGKSKEEAARMAETAAQGRSELKETAKTRYRNEGKSEEEAEQMAEIFVQGRDVRG